MKKTFLLICFICCSLALFSQKQICVDGSAGSEGDGSPSKPCKTIQAALEKAENGDIIKVAKGTYSEAVLISELKVQLLGGFSGSGDYNSANPQTNETIIRGTSAAAPCIKVKIVDAAISGSLKISGFTIRNGQRGIELDNDGWSEHLNNITIENNIIENNGLPNESQYGGGIGLAGKNVTIQKNVIRNNKSGRGAAIGVIGMPENFLIAENLIENNTGYDNHAGGVCVDGTGTVTKNVFDGNVAAKNFDYGWGGAIFVFCPAKTGTTDVTLSYNTYRNNYAPSCGGAVFVDDRATVRMEHELLYNNKTTKATGSAIYVDADWVDNNYTPPQQPSILYMNNCTVYGNTTDDNGAAVFVQGSIMHINNCIFWNNGKDFEFSDCSGSTPVPGATLTVNYTLTQQGFTGTGNISSDPLFADAPNGDFHEKSAYGRYNPATGLFVIDGVTSPAIDAGNPASPYSKEPQPNGGRVNMGRYGNTAEASKSAVADIEVHSLNYWKLFPNPAKESITICDLPYGSSVEIFDITGKKVYNSVVNSEQTTISTANFESGIYLMEVTHNGVVSNRKFIVGK